VGVNPDITGHYFRKADSVPTPDVIEIHLKAFTSEVGSGRFRPETDSKRILVLLKTMVLLEKDNPCIWQSF
jgi:hypothetical protein